MNIALILSGGTGSRLGGDIPKQYIEVAGKPIIAYCLETVCTHPDIDVAWVVAEEAWHPLIRKWAGVAGFSVPGKTRQLSILSGLMDIRERLLEWELQESWEAHEFHESQKSLRGQRREDIVLIHDAARPLVSTETISACLEGCRSHDGVMPALPVKDTVYYGVDGRIEALLERSKVIAGQAPEAFRLEKYYEATQALLPNDIVQINGSTEPAILAGLDVQYIPGDERNFKITTQADLDRFREIVAKNR